LKSNAAERTSKQSDGGKVNGKRQGKCTQQRQNADDVDDEDDGKEVNDGHGDGDKAIAQNRPSAKSSQKRKCN